MGTPWLYISHYGRHVIGLYWSLFPLNFYLFYWTIKTLKMRLRIWNSEGYKIMLHQSTRPTDLAVIFGCLIKSLHEKCLRIYLDIAVRSWQLNKWILKNKKNLITVTYSFCSTWQKFIYFWHTSVIFIFVPFQTTHHFCHLFYTWCFCNKSSFSYNISKILFLQITQSHWFLLTRVKNECGDKLQMRM